MTSRIKICGLTTPEAVEASAGADFIGFVFFPASPRNIAPSVAAALARQSSLPSVAVTVDADDATLDAIFKEFRPDYIQLHGKESPDRIAAIQAEYAVKIIKAVRVTDEADITQARLYEPIADMLMFDAGGASSLPGGNGVGFDWSLLKGKTFSRPWFLSGGLNATTIEEALRVSGATMVDVSSGVESAPGVKDPARIRAFITHVKSLSV